MEITEIHDVQIGGETIRAGSSIKYLGLHLDRKLNFKIQVTETSSKAEIAANNLARIMLNVSAAESKKKNLIAQVAHSILHYGAPNWATTLTQEAFKKFHKY